MRVKFASGRQVDTGGSAIVIVNGTSEDPVYLTSYRDDDIAGDTNNDGSTTGSTGDWGGFLIDTGNAGTPDSFSYAQISYATYGIRVSSTTSFTTTVSDSTFTSNNTGIFVRNKGVTLNTARNTFNKNVYTPISINPDIAAVSLGTGADADILGTGDNLNGYNAIGISYIAGGDNDRSGDCPSDLCEIPQREFAGISNIPYMLINQYYTDGSNDTLQINAGVVIKAIPSEYLRVNNGATLVVNGSSGSPVTVTSYRDDTVAGDTNNDGNSYGAISDWDSIRIESTGKSHSINFLNASFATYGLRITGSTATVSNSRFDQNSYGVWMQTATSPVFSNVNITRSHSYGMYNNNATVINAENIWWGSDSGPLDSDGGGSCAENAGYGETVRDTAGNPVDYCPFSNTEYNTPQLTTAATTDIDITTATGNGNLTALDGFRDIIEHGHTWATYSEPGALRPLAWYSMDDNASSSAIVDTLGNYDAVFHGQGGADDYTSAHHVAGKLSGALELDGTNDYIDLGDGFDEFNSGFSYSFWTYPTVAKNYSKFLSLEYADNNGTIEIFREGTTADLSVLVYKGTASGTKITATNALAENEWQHISVSIDTQGITKIYRNGVLLETGRSYFPNQIERTYCYIGKTAWDGEDRYAGYLDDLRIYNGVLSQSEVAALYNGGGGTSEYVSPYTDLGAKSATGSYSSSITGLSGGTTYYTRAYAVVEDGRVYYGGDDSFLTLDVGTPPTASAASLSGTEDIYAGKTLSVSGVYTDVDGPDNLDKMYLQIQNPGGTNIEYYAEEGANGSGLSPVAVTGSEYVTSITYSRTKATPTANDTTVAWEVSFDWDWVPNSNIEFGVKAVDDMSNDSGYSYTNSDFEYINSLNFTGTLTATGSINGSLNTGDWVAGSENVDFTGLKVVYNGTVDQYPNDSDFDVSVCNDDLDCSTDDTSSGETFAATISANATSDPEDTHLITIENIPAGGSDSSSESFVIRVDASTPDIVDITGDNEGVWQKTEPGPVISWTDPASPSDDTFYITTDGTEPASSNHDYVTSLSTYDLPDLGQGETSVKVRPQNSVGTYGTAREFLLRYDTLAPNNVSDLTLSVLSTTSIKLTWTNPTATDFDHVSVVRKLGSSPASPTDGTEIYSGSLTTFTDTSLTQSTKYYYAVFSLDTLDNVSSGALGSATTATPESENEVDDEAENDNEMAEEIEDEAEEAEVIDEVEGEIEVEVDGIQVPAPATTVAHAFVSSNIVVRVPQEVFAKEDGTQITGVYLVLGEQVYLMSFEKECGCYVCRVSAPSTQGAHSFRVLASYSDGTARTATYDLQVDPYGYVFTQKGKDQLRINGAQVTLYVRDSESERAWVTGDEEKYPNPQTTNETGEYSFFVSPGEYRVVAEAEGYHAYSTDWFTVEDTTININLELKPLFNWWIVVYVGFGAFLIVALVIAILYLRRKKRKKDQGESAEHV